jgi:HK97 family phage portal protein
VFKFITKWFKRSKSVQYRTTGIPLHSPSIGQIFQLDGSINAKKAMGVSGVWRAITILAETIASLPIHLFIEKENGDTRKDKKHPLHYILHKQPHPLYTSFNFWEAIIYNLALHGNAYAIIERDADTMITGLLLVESNKVAPYYNSKLRRLFYEIEGYQDGFKDEEIIHITGMSHNGYMGISKLQNHGKILNGAADLRDYAVNFFANGANPSGVLEYENELTDTQFLNLKRSWQKEYSGPENAGKTPILEYGVQYKKIGSNPKEAGLIENQKFYLEDISRIFGVPLHLLANLDRATFNNIEHLTLQFVKLTIMQLCKRIEMELERKLLTRNKSTKNKSTKSESVDYSIKFNLEGLLRGDTKNRAEYYRTMFAIGAMSINEIRQKENMNSIEGGDVHYRPLNMEDILKKDDDGEEEDDLKLENNEKSQEKGENQTDQEDARFSHKAQQKRRQHRA